MKNGPPACPLPGGLPHSAAMANRRFYIHINLFSRKMFFHSLAGPPQGTACLMCKAWWHFSWIFIGFYNTFTARPLKSKGLGEIWCPGGPPGRRGGSGTSRAAHGAIASLWISCISWAFSYIFAAQTVKNDVLDSWCALSSSHGCNHGMETCWPTMSPADFCKRNAFHHGFAMEWAIGIPQES